MPPENQEGPKLPKNPFRVFNFHDWVYIPHILGRGERAILGFFIALALIGGVAVGTLLLHRFTREAPAVGGTLREGVIRPPERVNPLFLAINDTDRDITGLLYSKIFSYDAEGNLVPDLAESYSTADGGKTYIVTLKQNAFWHDGLPVNADDVVFTIRAIQNPDYKSSLRPNWQGVTVERLSDYTVALHLKQAYSPFLQNLALPIIPKHVWEKVPVESASLTEANTKPIGSGPYMFKQLARDSNGAITRYTLEANPHYYREGPYIQTIEFTFYDSASALKKAYQASDIDGISTLTASDVESLKNLGASVSAMKMPRIFGIFLNENNPALQDKRVREALALAIPKNELITKTLGGGAVPIDTPIPPGTFGYNPDIQKTPFDPHQAKKLLTEAGWQDVHHDGKLYKKAAKKKAAPIPLAITLTTSDWKDLASSANLIKGYWESIGVQTNVKIMPIADLESQAIRPRQYDALLFGEILGRDPDPFAFWHSSQLKDPGLNIALYHSPKVDSLLETARRTTDQDIVQKDYEDFQAIIDRDFPTIFLYSPLYYYGTRATVHTKLPDTIVLPSDRFSEINAWYIRTKRVF